MKMVRFEIRKIKIDFPSGKRPEIMSAAGSVLLHAGIFFSVLILINISDDASRINPPFVQVTTQDFNSRTPNGKERINASAKDLKPEKSIDQDEEKNQNELFRKERLGSSAAYYSFSKIKADTSVLDQVYKEPTFNVSIKYPAGWTYVDQDIRNKLDGVTFWSNIGDYSPPPYVHLEVKEKDMFSRSRYKYKTEINDFTVYYNNPDSLEGQITQTFYIRTNSDVDFSLQLIMKGESAFKSFQPVFFGMIKSFKFGRGLF